MRQPTKGGHGLRVFALLAFLAAALSSFGQVPGGQSGDFPKIARPQEPGFVMGVQETDSSLLNYDVTGATVINPTANRRDAFSRIQLRGREYEQISESTSAEINTGLNLRPLFGLSDNLRRFRGTRPTNAIVEAGPFFLKVNEVTAAMIVSDNVNFVPNNAEWGAIAELRMRLSAILQISPTWRLMVSGNIIYLPFVNKFGVEGFGIGEDVGFIADEELQPVTHMQLAYQTRWADWTVQAVDDLNVRYVTFEGDYDAFVHGVDGPDNIHAEDQAGRYVFANGTTIPNQNVDHRSEDFIDIRTFLALQNTVAATATRLLPTETRMTFGASHSDFWFQDGGGPGTNGLGFSNYSVDRAFVTLRNERESMRFKPFIYYDAYRYNYDPDWTQQAGAGLSGPVTENLQLFAEGGYQWGPLINNIWFYRLRLVQTPGPYTQQFLSYSRIVTEPVKEVRDTYRYGINQVLGTDMWGRLYVQRSIFKPEQFGVFGSVEDRAATRIIWRPTPGHSIIAYGAYTESRFDNPSRDRETTWEARAEFHYDYRPDVRFSLIYRYLNINTRQTLLQRDTAENLWLLTARKFF